MSDKGVCWTTPATPGLLNTLTIIWAHSSQIWLILRHDRQQLSAHLSNLNKTMFRQKYLNFIKILFNFLLKIWFPMAKHVKSSCTWKFWECVLSAYLLFSAGLGTQKSQKGNTTKKWDNSAKPLHFQVIYHCLTIGECFIGVWVVFRIVFTIQKS